MKDRNDYTTEDFDAEVMRQREKFRLAYILRRLIGWPKIAWLFGLNKAGWYLVRENALTETCFTIGPFNTQSEGLRTDRTEGRSYLILLWEEPEGNDDRGHRRYARPWYRVPARK